MLFSGVGATSAADALSASVAGQRSIAAHNDQPSSLAHMRVRMGLSVGDVAVLGHPTERHEAFINLEYGTRAVGDVVMLFALECQ